jgi:hypothetical protein
MYVTKRLETLHELDVKMAIEFFERSPPSALQAAAERHG